ncbi:MAG: Jag N-terminal domain-containing protein [Desulfurivibrio sp.]
MEYRGDDVDQAINNACIALGVERKDLEVQVVTTGSAGFLGFGRRKAMVRVGLRAGAGAGIGKTAVQAPVAAESAPSRPAKPQSPRPETRKPAAVAETTPEVAAEPLSAAELAEVSATVDRLLELSGCAVQARIAGEQSEGKVRIDLVGEESELLVGPEGQVLDSIQYLLRKMLTKKLGRRVILELDAGDYRARRCRELEERALALAAEVKSSGQSRTLAAVGPAERRIIHLALQGDSEIRSRSVGEGLFKKVLIHPPGKGRKRPPRPRGKGRS